MLDKIDDNNTKIIIMYPHPDLRVFKDKKKLNEYNFIKDNDFELLKSYPNIVVFESFKFLCMKCSVYDYSKLLNDDGNHFNLHGSLLLIDSLKKIISYN